MILFTGKPEYPKIEPVEGEVRETISFAWWFKKINGCWIIWHKYKLTERYITRKRIVDLSYGIYEGVFGGWDIVNYEVL